MKHHALLSTQCFSFCTLLKLQSNIASDRNDHTATIENDRSLTAKVKLSLLAGTTKILCLGEPAFEFMPTGVSWFYTVIPPKQRGNFERDYNRLDPQFFYTYHLILYPALYNRFGRVSLWDCWVMNFKLLVGPSLHSTVVMVVQRWKLSSVIELESFLQNTALLTCYIISQGNVKLWTEAITPEQNKF
jgi:hypothetical protein